VKSWEWTTVSGSPTTLHPARTGQISGVPASRIGHRDTVAATPLGEIGDPGPVRGSGGEVAVEQVRGPDLFCPRLDPDRGPGLRAAHHPVHPLVVDLHTGVLVPLAQDASLPTGIFWLHIRAGAVGVCVIFIWLFNLIVALAFPSLLSALGAGPNFLFFAVMTALAFLFVKKLVPETKGRSLEAIERDLLHGASAPTGAT